MLTRSVSPDWGLGEPEVGEHLFGAGVLSSVKRPVHDGTIGADSHCSVAALAAHNTVTCEREWHVREEGSVR